MLQPYQKNFELALGTVATGVSWNEGFLGLFKSDFAILGGLGGIAVVISVSRDSKDVMQNKEVRYQQELGCRSLESF